jgi:hypothetical protein
MRRVRRRARARDIDWIDALYRAYLTGLIGVVVVVVASGWVGDADVSASGIDHIRDHGAAALGLGVAVFVAMGLRSGARGGPLAVEAADVRHVLLAPIDRRHALQSPVLRQLRHAGFVGFVVGAIAGQLAARRLPGNPVAWTVSSGAALSIAMVTTIGAGYIAAGRRLNPRWAGAIGALLLAWSGLDVLGVAPPSLTNLLARIALWPLDFDPLAFVGVVVAVVVVVAGVWSIGGLAIEAAERRSTLIGRLAFAATLQDLRTVIVLRRQLAQEHPRRTPWIPWVPGAARWPVWTRGCRGILRWPIVRVGRLAVLGAIAGAAGVGAARGTTPLIIVAGLALYVAALDAIEALAQEVDHPSRTDVMPLPRGAVHIRHLPVAVVVMALVAAVGVATALAFQADTTTLLVGAVTGVTATLASVAGAAVGTVAGPPDPVSNWALGAPEVAGVQMVLRLIWPPALAVLGVTPVLAGARIPDAGASAVERFQPAAAVGGGMLVLSALVIAWVYAREPVLERIAASFQSSGSSS